MDGSFDLRAFRRYYGTVGEARHGVVPYLAAEGEGTEMDDAFWDVARVLRAAALAVRRRERSAGFDFVLPPLESQWMDGRFRLLMRMPFHLSEAAVAAACRDVKDPAARQVHLLRLDEGRVVQGPPERVAAYVAEKGLVAHGPRHEVFLGDPRRSKRPKRIVRQPVRRGP